MRQLSGIDKIGKQWGPETRKAQECLLIQLYFLRLLSGRQREEVCWIMVQKYDRGTESTKKQGNRL